MSAAEGREATHPFDADPEASLPGAYCRCGYDVDAHSDKGNATVRDGRYVLSPPWRGATPPNDRGCVFCQARPGEWCVADCGGPAPVIHPDNVWTEGDDD